MGTLLGGSSLLLGALPAQQKPNQEKGHQRPLCTQPKITWSDTTRLYLSHVLSSIASNRDGYAFKPIQP
ncbi:hypothetical protein ACYZTM_00285 [Pseudomonas sp. MDT2-39-1]